MRRIILEVLRGSVMCMFYPFPLVHLVTLLGNFEGRCVPEPCGGSSTSLTRVKGLKEFK